MTPKVAVEKHVAGLSPTKIYLWDMMDHVVSPFDVATPECMTFSEASNPRSFPYPVCVAIA